MFRCAFLGCGPRARQHAKAYATVTRGRIVAICDLDEARRDQFGDEVGIAARYADIRQMLDTERPDVLHIVTPPSLRFDLMTIASEHGVPAVIIEKPIALWGEDFRRISALAETTKTRFCVNTQLHFHARNLELKRVVAEGKIGQVRFVDASARSTPLDQGVHVLELCHSYNGFSPFTSVFGQVSDASEMGGRQPAPGMAVASLAFANGVTGLVQCGRSAPFATDRTENRYHHKRIAVYGTDGFCHWTMGGWERRTPEGGYESGSHDYGQEDDLAQGRLTEAVFDWLLDDGKPHPTRLERSLEQFNVVLGLYTSALRSEPVALPCEPPDGLKAALEARLGR